MQALGDRSLFFLHVPKTAGTSLRELLSPRFSPAEILAFERGDEPELRREKLARVDSYRFVHGHVPYALADRFECRPFVVTILRDPLERAVSAFHFMQRQAAEVARAVEAGQLNRARGRDYAAAGRMPIGEFIRNEPLAASRHLGNLQTWLLSTPNLNERFEYRDDYRVAVTGSDLVRAKENLAACEVVGLTERMSESVELLAHALQTRPFGEASTANRSPARPAFSTLDAVTIAALHDLTACDRELYAFACRLFEERRLLLKAARPRVGVTPRRLAPSPVFTFDSAIPGDGWYAPERDGERWYSWTGPACESTIELASPPGVELVLKVGVQHVLREEFLSRLEIRLNGLRLGFRVQAMHPEAAGHLLTATLPRGLLRAVGERNSIAIRVPEVLRPCEQDPAAEDSRLLGIAVHRIELAAIEPASPVSRVLNRFYGSEGRSIKGLINRSAGRVLKIARYTL